MTREGQTGAKVHHPRRAGQSSAGVTDESFTEKAKPGQFGTLYADPCEDSDYGVFDRQISASGGERTKTEVAE